MVRWHPGQPLLAVVEQHDLGVTHALLSRPAGAVPRQTCSQLRHTTPTALAQRATQ